MTKYGYVFQYNKILLLIISNTFKEPTLENSIWKTDELPSSGKFSRVLNLQEIYNRLRSGDAEGDDENVDRIVHVHRNWIKSHTEPQR